ncbi:putative signal transducing protein [Algoriphagus sp.]|uniref:putative signal transducing protein n=1 Tax=Algoriphagus sp. TaxID=1872435 RepID=UPI003919A0BB
MDSWIKVFENQNQIRAEIVKGVLEENGISAVVMNKKETVYHVFGTYEVLVPKGDALLAMQLIQNEITF